MECVVGKDIDGVEMREDPAVEVQLSVEDNAVEWREIGLEKEVVVEGGLREKFLVHFLAVQVTSERIRESILVDNPW